MPDDKLSEREAALIAQAREELGKPATQPAAAAAPAKRAPPDAAIDAPAAGDREPDSDPETRLAALMAVARAESERLRRRQLRLYLWTPLAILCAIGLWALLWLWL